MEEPTHAMVEEQIACMESSLMDVEEGAGLWCKQTANEDMRSRLRDIEVAAQKLCALVGHLGPPLDEKEGS